jgi:hypothetical protein
MGEIGGSSPSRRSRWQFVLAVVFFVLTLLAVIVPVWIEEVTGRSPDGGNGELELLLAVPFGLVALVLGARGWRASSLLREQRKRPSDQSKPTLGSGQPD